MVDPLPEVDGFCRWLSGDRGASKQTLRAYRLDLRQFAGLLRSLGVEGIQDVGVEHVRTFVRELHSDGMTGKTINRKLAALRTFFTFHQLNHGLDGNPAELVVNRKESQRLPRIPSVSEMEGLLAAPDDSPTGLRDRAALELLYGSGLRAAELLSLDVGDADLKTRFVLVMGKGRRERLTPFGRPAEEALRAYLEVRADINADADGALFVTPRGRMSGGTLRSMLHHYTVQAGICKRLTPHLLRHAAATHMHANGASIRHVQVFLGHERIGTTALYTRMEVRRLKRVLDRALGR